MLELLICSALTIFPDYLYRRYRQGKRFGKEITLFSVWFELRWGITACLLLTIGLITVIFYNHPTTDNVANFYRTVPIIPETAGRVSEVLVTSGDDVRQGAPLFKLDSSRQQASVETARRKVAEVDAALTAARANVAAAEGQVQQARAMLEQARDELDTKVELRRRNQDIVATREIERLQNTVDARQGAVSAAIASREAAEAKSVVQLPAEKASAEAALAQAQIELDKMIVYAGVAGRVEQFALRPGDLVNPFMRPAGLMIPTEAGRRQLQAGFNQLEAQVLRPGMAAEALCVSKPWTIIPLVVTGVQDYIAAGQFRQTDTLLDVQQVVRPGTVTVFLEPLYPGGLDGITPGSSCIANAYSSNHDAIQSKDTGTLRKLALHGIDATAVVHAAMLRIQAVLLPIKVLVLSGH